MPATELKNYKLIQEWKDYVTGIKNYLYSHNIGLKILISNNPNTVDFDFSVVIKGGSYYEKQLNVPCGTAHFLEHVIFGNPNKLLRSRKELNESLYGNRYKASFNANAYTSREFIYLYANGHHNAAKRMVRHILSQLDYPEINFERYIEKERKIILNELYERQQEDKTSWIQYEKFLWEDTNPEYTGHVIGNEESIRSIGVKDLIKFYKAVFVPENMIITIQSNSKFNKSILMEINKFVINLANNDSKLVQNLKDLTEASDLNTFTNMMPNLYFFRLTCFI